MENLNNIETIIVVGSGGREYSIIKKLHQDCKHKINIICLETNKNDAILDICDLVITVDNNNLSEIVEHIVINPKYQNIRFAIVGPENFLKYGVANIFKSYNISCIGPTECLSRLETSKSFCRNFLNKYSDLSCFSPNFKVVTNLDSLETIANSFKQEIVIKRDGLCRGKGVYVENSDFIRENINKLHFDKSESLVIEEKLYGDEYSLMSFVDTNGNMAHFPPIKDYKRLYDGNMGCNTGGMGCIIDSNNTLPYLTENDIKLSRDINERVIKHINNEIKGERYVGVLYGSFMKTKDGNIKIIEYNCRFGDPECILALNQLQTNFYDICIDIIDGNLKYDLDFSNKAAICVYVVPKLYCINQRLNKYDIYFDKAFNKNNLIYSNIEIDNGHIYSLGSRCFAICKSNTSLYECFHSIYSELSKVYGYLHYRCDIGAEYMSNYEQSGVSIDLADNSLNKVKNLILSTYNKNITSEYGSFGGEIKIDNTILVASIDGVGTKTAFARKVYGAECFKNLGKDIVAHSINDILVQGATPLCFLDYFGTNTLKQNEFINFISGVSDYCKKYGNISILGGETAEMPLIYNTDMTDLVGCILGIKNTNFFKHPIQSGDIILNISSNGPHTNGFTLINKIFENYENNELIETLLTPHRCYLNEVNEFIDKFGYDNIHGMCHITGGGVHGNLKRVIKDCEYQLFDTILPDWCEDIMKIGKIDINEMLKVFNCGYGFIIITNSNILKKINTLGYKIDHIGNIK